MAEAKNFPENSKEKKAITEATERPEVEKVVKGNVVKLKKPFTKKLADVFLNGQAPKEVAHWVVSDVLAPALRNLAVEMVEKGISRALLGEDGPTRRGHGGRNSVISYDRPSDRMSARREVDVRSRKGRRAGNQEIDEIWLETIEDAEAVVEIISDRVEKYDYVTVAELYKLCDVPFNYVDRDWGWTNLRRVTIRQKRSGGYVIDMPDPEPID